MERRTVKVGITGKYGTRYGAKLRKQAKAIEILQRTKYTCPFCGKNSIRRHAVGIWRCKACRRTCAGGAWEFATSAALTAKTTINRLKKEVIEIKKGVDEEIVEEEEVKKPEKKKEKKTESKKTESKKADKPREKKGGKK
jgi:large subunit ribosomal protein L37Ae